MIHNNILSSATYSVPLDSRISTEYLLSRKVDSGKGVDIYVLVWEYPVGYWGGRSSMALRGGGCADNPVFSTPLLS